MMKWKRVAILGFVAAGLLAHRPAGAQVFTPTFMSPRLSSDLGVYLSDGPGEFAIEGIIRRNFGRHDLGFRLGLADTDDLTFLLGGEFRHPLSVSAPIDLAVTGFAQGGFGDANGGGFLVGLALGHTFTSPELAFTPYLHPRIGGIEPFGRDDFDLELLADLGFDLSFGTALDLRFAITFADEHGAEFGIGLAWR